MTNTSVPPEFQPLLPSSSVAQFDPIRDRRYIIENLLKKSTLNAWIWMLRTYHQDEIEDVLKQSRTLTPRDVTIWAEYYNIPRKDIACLQKSSRKTLRNSWAY